jgi:hypothetical protein
MVYFNSPWKWKSEGKFFQKYIELNGNENIVQQKNQCNTANEYAVRGKLISGNTVTRKEVNSPTSNI